ncbi:GNAT family N-acetyltransferase [Paractinoplanes rishiriensis]|uniref:N-acetyltransferase n=1 Tax=Paractinoplanes rishiriensis TaxID=1050105 RepID=A0A919MMA7_9ACTN|nr:GNAT family N-acetyltransferase [Actinoplanes rishiriensis]GIE92766.1 N-acetyltransferase [Actinoplanes rishiriensis]
MTARQATVDDASELIRLRTVMLGVDRDDSWCLPAQKVLAQRLAEAAPTMAAFVIDRPGGGLAACATGTVEARLGAPGDPSGLVGYVFNVATDPDQRRRGHSRACLTALLDWFRGHDIRKVDLRASAMAEPLYRSLGFERTADPAMRLKNL